VTRFPLDELIGAKEYEDALLNLINIVQQQEFPGLVEALKQCTWYEVADGKAGHNSKKSI